MFFFYAKIEIYIFFYETRLKRGFFTWSVIWCLLATQILCRVLRMNNSDIMKSKIENYS